MIYLAISAAAMLLIVMLVVSALLAPIETMSWWAGWSDRETDDDMQAAPRNGAPASARAFIVYLAGVNVISGDALTNAETRFLKRLGAIAPGCAFVDDIFPYSPSGRPLIGSTRIFEWLWAAVSTTKMGKRRRLADIVNLRNIFQVLVAADERYGPIYNFGAADMIYDGLVGAGYVRGSQAPVFVIAYSGGGQIAAGTVGFLKRRLDAPITIISVGGIFSSAAGIEQAAAFHHLRGGRDKTVRLGAVMFPGRWKFFPSSTWNRLRQAGKTSFYDMPGITHLGPGSYFGRMKSESDATNFDRTLDCVTSILNASPHFQAALSSGGAPRAYPHGSNEEGAFR